MRETQAGDHLWSRKTRWCNLLLLSWNSRYILMPLTKNTKNFYAPLWWLSVRITVTDSCVLQEAAASLVSSQCKQALVNWPCILTQLKCAGYKDPKIHVYISNFKQNRLEYFAQVFKSELYPPLPPIAFHHKRHVKSSATISFLHSFSYCKKIASVNTATDLWWDLYSFLFKIFLKAILEAL